jgi:uncharacterized protein
MERFLGGAAAVGVWAGVVAWTLALAAACLVVLLSLPGGWIALGLAVLWDAFHAFHAIGWVRLAIFAGLLLVGEAVEAALGSLYVARMGATRWGIVGTFLGGIAGAAVGSAMLPLVGTFAGAFVGAFAGAVGGEYLRDRRLEPSLRVGFHATVGRFLALFAKGLLAAGGAALAAWPVWAALLGRSAP